MQVARKSREENHDELIGMSKNRFGFVVRKKLHWGSGAQD